MNVCFYLAEYGNFFDHLIGKTADDGPEPLKISHCELQFSSGICWSSSPRDGGVRFKMIDVTNQQWIVMPVDVPPLQEAIMRTWCQSKVGLGYDWLGAVGVVVPFVQHEPKRLFCSEALVLAFQEIGWMTNIRAVKESPAALMIEVGSLAKRSYV